MRWLGLILRNSGLNWSPAPISIGITLYARPSSSSAMCTLWPFGGRRGARRLPVVGAGTGIAAGAGATLGLACDSVLAARSATLVQAFAKIGLIPDCGGPWFLPRLVGPARARALSMLAEPLSAET